MSEIPQHIVDKIKEKADVWNDEIKPHIARGAVIGYLLAQKELADRPIPTSVEDEAEVLYPFPEDNESGVYDDLKNIREWCRSAHITCARQYMDTIEKLRAKIVSLEEELALYRLEK